MAPSRDAPEFERGYRRFLPFLPPALWLGFLALDFAFALLFDLDDFFAFAVRAGLRLVDEAFAFAVLPLFFAALLLLFPRLFDAAKDFLLRGFATALAFTATFLTAFLTAFLAAGAAEREAAARPAIAPSTPPTTAPTGPAMLPRTAPAAAPAVCLEMGGISMFSDDEPDVSGGGVDG
jgi:hypothetical protein